MAKKPDELTRAQMDVVAEHLVDKVAKPLAEQSGYNRRLPGEVFPRWKERNDEDREVWRGIVRYFHANPIDVADVATPAAIEGAKAPAPTEAK